MAANALSILDQGPPQLPAEMAAFFEEQTNIPPKQTTPTLSFGGKTWAISLNGEATKLVRKNEDGDEVPVSIFRGIILDWNKRRGRAYYDGPYDPAKPGVPACWSDDGVTPSEDVKEPQCAKCADCPMAVKGSKITEQAKASVACSEHRMVVVVPASKPDFEPLRLKLPITSDYDGQSPEHEAAGWFAFKNYMDLLRARGVDHSAKLVTKMKFDPNKEYPKVLFSVDKWVEPAVLKNLIPVIQSDTVKNLLSGTWTPAGADGEKVEGATGKSVLDKPIDQEAAAKAAAFKTAREAEDKAAKAAAKAEAKAKREAAEAAAKLTAAKKAVYDDEEGDVVLPGVAKTASGPKATVAASDPVPVGGGIEDLLKEWE